MSANVRMAKNANVNLVDYDENVDEIIFTKWDLNSKLDENIIYNGNFVKSYADGIGFDVKTLESEGFSTPILFENKAGLGLIMPPDEFTVDDVAANVGKKRILDVVDVRTQDAIGMKMSDWCEYYKCSVKTQLLNVISLEYSQSKMDNIVKAPDIVLELDWLENCWPQRYRDISTDNKSYLKTLTYPKVRKYCLMSVSGCFTDFHIDLGGTSVWYHIFKGEKVFWLVPPTEANLNAYEKWCLSSEQSSYFFPDLVEECQKIHLKQGNTFMIPSGWIHGVYTPVDSLVFGGNFLHSFSIPMQLKIWGVEEKIKVGTKYRYPFFVDMHWYALANFVNACTGKIYAKHDSPMNDCSSNEKAPLSLNRYEIKGINHILQWLMQTCTDESNLTVKNKLNFAQLLLDAEDICSSISKSEPCLFQPNGDIKTEFLKSFGQDRHDTSSDLPVALDSSNHSKLKIDLSNKNIKNKTLKKSSLKPRCPKSESIQVAEIPRELFDKITQRTGSRQIVRPDRLIENPSK